MAGSLVPAPGVSSGAETRKTLLHGGVWSQRNPGQVSLSTCSSGTSHSSPSSGGGGEGRISTSLPPA